VMMMIMMMVTIIDDDNNEDSHVAMQTQSISWAKVTDLGSKTNHNIVTTMCENEDMK